MIEQTVTCQCIYEQRRVEGTAGSRRFRKCDPATQKLIDTCGWYKKQPHIDLLAVHLPVHRFPNMGLVVSNEMIERYYAEETKHLLTPSTALLDAAGIRYTPHRRVGPIAESIVEQAKQFGSDMIYMGTRGQTALTNMMLGMSGSRAADRLLWVDLRPSLSGQ